MRTFLASAFFFLGGAALAQDYRLGELNIDHPIVYETPATARAGGGYLTIENLGASDDRLIAIEGEFPRLEIHTTVMDSDVAMMQRVDALEIPAGETVELAPGGMHLMIMGLSEPFVEGKSIPLTLVFENAGPIDVEFIVEARPDAGGHDH